MAFKARCLISLDFPTNVTQAYRHMFTTLEERARILDDHLASMGEDIVDFLGSEGVAELEAVGVPRQELVTCVGRICNEVCGTSVSNSWSVLSVLASICDQPRASLDEARDHGPGRPPLRSRLDLSRAVARRSVRIEGLSLCVEAHASPIGGSSGARMRRLRSVSDIRKASRSLACCELGE